MSGSARLTSSIWVDAYRRRVEQAGGYVTIRKRGSGEAGAIFLLISDADNLSRLYGPAPQSLYGEGATSRRFSLMSGDRLDGLQVQTMLDKQMRFDPDLWVVDVDDREGRHFLLEEEIEPTETHPKADPSTDDPWSR
jgi:hypothetical protein